MEPQDFEYKIQVPMSPRDRIIQLIGEKKMTVNDLAYGMGFGSRMELLYHHLEPAIVDGLVQETTVDNQQQYVLTAKGLALYNGIMAKNYG